MSSDPNHSLAAFIERYFTCQGAAIEKRGTRLEVLAPTELAQQIGIPDYLTLTVGGDATGDHSVHYGSPLLEKLTRAAGEQIPLAVVRLRFHYLKSQGFDRLVKDLFTFHDAIVRVESTAVVHTEYLLMTCRYLAQSDEQKEGLMPLAFNLETGAQAGSFDGILDTIEKDFEAGGPCDALEREKIDALIRWVKRRAPKILRTHLQSFRESMNRRFKRDVANLEEYYTELKREMTAHLTRSGQSEQLILERKAKIDLIPAEMAKKKDDLFKKYSINVRLRLSGAILVRTPAVKLFCRATIGRRKKSFTLLYNPIEKSIDPMVCEGCGNSAYHLGACDQLHLLCLRCGQHCPLCTSASK